MPTTGNKGTLVYRVNAHFKIDELEELIKQHESVFQASISSISTTGDCEFFTDTFVLLQPSHSIELDSKNQISVGGENFCIPESFYTYLLKNNYIYMGNSMQFIDRDPLLFSHVLYEIFPHYDKPIDCVPREQLEDELLFYSCYSSYWQFPAKM